MLVRAGICKAFPNAGAVPAAIAAVLVSAALAGPALAAPPRRSLGDGGWCWFADPRGVRYDGLHKRTYIGWVGQNGDIKISAYDHDSLISTTALLRGQLQVDDHANPALLVRPDGRLVVFYSAHTGRAMFYRISTNPEDVTSWQPPQTLPTNTPGIYGYTYPNPIHLSAEQRTYLFWRGGNYNPNFSSQADGDSRWSPARTLIRVPAERPYVKYDTNGSDKIGFAFTNAHPASVRDNNIYYAYYRRGGIFRANGTRIGGLARGITPGQADKVYDTRYKAWVHDMAFDASGRPVIVFAAFPSTADHRYMYARWTGRRWVYYQITRAGGSISGDPREPYYSAGITLDHEDPSMVYLSRNVGGIFEIETWHTANGGQTWTRQSVTAPSSANNFRPISPRGLIPFSGDMSVVWVRGIYNSYINYKTSISTLFLTGGNHPPIAQAEVSNATGPAALTVGLDASASSDPDGSVADWSWDFGDGTSGSGPRMTHTYTRPGRYFPKVTVTDNDGSKDVYVTEVVVDPGSAPAVSTVSAGAVAATSATLHGRVNSRGQQTRYRFEYGPSTSYSSATPEQTASPTDAVGHSVSADLTGLTEGTTYHFRIVATNSTGTSVGADRAFTASATSRSSPYHEAVLSTAGLIDYWRLGETSGSAAENEASTDRGSYLGGHTFGRPGASPGDSDPATAFDGVTGEMAASGGGLSFAGSLEGWFDWRAGPAVMRDETRASTAGWILAYGGGGSLAYRLGGTSFSTGRSVAAVMGGWHHFVATKDGGRVAFYVDGQLVHTGSGAGNGPTRTPWHVMRNGAFPQYARGTADEIAIYDVALSPATVRAHYEAARRP